MFIQFTNPENRCITINPFRSSLFYFSKVQGGSLHGAFTQENSQDMKNDVSFDRQLSEIKVIAIKSTFGLQAHLTMTSN